MKRIAALGIAAMTMTAADSQVAHVDEIGPGESVALEFRQAEPGPFDALDPFEHPWLHWLESRTHFPRPSPYGEPGSVVIVGHEALENAVRAVGKLIEENERLRAENEELRAQIK